MQKTGKKESQWPLFPHMFFLTQVLEPELSANIYGEEYYHSEYQNSTVSVNTTSPEPPNQVYIKESDYVNSFEDENLDDHSESVDYDEVEMLDPEDEIELKPESIFTVEPVNENIENLADIDFLREHIMPLLGAINTNKKLQVRIRLQQVLMSELLNYKNVKSSCDQVLKSSNYDELFLFSLLSHMEATYDYRKVIVRSKMLEILKDELEDESMDVKGEMGHE